MQAEKQALSYVFDALVEFFDPRGVDCFFATTDKAPTLSDTRIVMMPGGQGGRMCDAPFDPRSQMPVQPGVQFAVYEQFTITLTAYDERNKLDKLAQHSAARQLFDLLVVCLSELPVDLLSSTWVELTENQRGAALRCPCRVLTYIAPNNPGPGQEVFPWTALVRTHPSADGEQHEDQTVPALIA